MHGSLLGSNGPRQVWQVFNLRASSENSPHAGAYKHTVQHSFIKRQQYDSCTTQCCSDRQHLQGAFTWTVPATPRLGQEACPVTLAQTQDCEEIFLEKSLVSHSLQLKVLPPKEFH